MEKIIDLLKVLLGKHLYPAIGSIAMAILFVALKPNLFGIETVSYTHLTLPTTERV